jgi:RimJ/RimL family protein N-acetyltransferase
MDAGEQTLYQLLTGVRREYRRRNIALALKLRTIAYAKARQIKAVITNTDPSNYAMLALNERLGFVSEPDQLFFKKEIRKD